MPRLDRGRKDFDLAAAKRLTDQYRAVRHLLIGDWYPLTPFRSKDGWLASQYHRGDLQEGMVLAFRRKGTEGRSIRVQLRGLDSNAVYELKDTSAGSAFERTGAFLAEGMEISISKEPGSSLLVYRKKPQFPRQ